MSLDDSICSFKFIITNYKENNKIEHQTRLSEQISLYLKIAIFFLHAVLVMIQFENISLENRRHAILES